MNRAAALFLGAARAVHQFRRRDRNPMQCPFCSGVPPLLENSIERPHVIQTDFWYAASEIGPVPEGMETWDFDGATGAPLAVRYVEKREGGATLTAHSYT